MNVSPGEVNAAVRSIVRLRVGISRGLALAAAWLAIFSGCERQSVSSAGPPPLAASAEQRAEAAGSHVNATGSGRHVHEHEHHAPHGGTLIELGEDFAQLEWIHDPQRGELTVYVLDGCAENAVRIAMPELEWTIVAPLATSSAAAAEPIQFKLAAVTSGLTGERPGDASAFQVQDARLRQHGALRGILKKIVVRGQTFEDVPVALETE